MALTLVRDLVNLGSDPSRSSDSLISVVEFIQRPAESLLLKFIEAFMLHPWDWQALGWLI